jgi:hypothetical protein
MAISTSDLGSHSTTMTIGAGETQANLLGAIESWITNHGWASYDASAGTNARAYRAVNKDGSTYKYIVIDVNSTGYIIMKNYESWNSGTHVGTNLSTGSDQIIYAQQVDLTNGSLLHIGANARWIWLLSVKGGVYGSSTGNSPCFVCEFTRDMDSDTVVANYPKGHWSSYNQFFPSTTVAPFMYCRDLANQTGTAANNRSLANCRTGGWGYNWSNGSIQYPAAMTPYVWAISGKRSLYTVTGFTTHSTNALTTTPACNGRAYGLKVGTLLACAFGDTTSIKCDADFFEDNTGVATDFIYLNTHLTNQYVCFPK